MAAANPFGIVISMVFILVLSRSKEKSADFLFLVFFLKSKVTVSTKRINNLHNEENLYVVITLEKEVKRKKTWLLSTDGQKRFLQSNFFIFLETLSPFPDGLFFLFVPCSLFLQDEREKKGDEGLDHSKFTQTRKLNYSKTKKFLGHPLQRSTVG